MVTKTDAVIVSVIIVGKRLSKEMISKIFTCPRISNKYGEHIEWLLVRGGLHSCIVGSK